MEAVVVPQEAAPPKEIKILVAAPFVGELGWEMFSWQPLIRRIWLDSKPDKAIVYGAKGRSLLYDFAEYRVVDIPKHESECLCWRDLAEHKADLDKLIDDCSNEVKKEMDADKTLKPHIDYVSYRSFQRYSDPMYSVGAPNLLKAPEGTHIQPTEGWPDYGSVVYVLCTRDRAMGSFRNWDRECWAELAGDLAREAKTIVIGTTREEWQIPSQADNRLNQTTIDDLIVMFSFLRRHYKVLAVGGSTGTMHLASRCGVPHLVWGGEKNVERYAETNWFGVDCHVYEWGWSPEPGIVAAAAKHWAAKGEWL